MIGALRRPRRRQSAGDQRGNHRGDHREHGNDLNGGGLGLGLADVVLQDIQLITEDHLVGNDEAGAADEGAVEIAAILQRRGKGLNNDLPQRFAGILVYVLGRGFTRGDNHGKHAGEQCAQAGAHEADFHVGDEEEPISVLMPLPITPPPPMAAETVARDSSSTRSEISA